jgi:hypothetical protein
VRSGDESTDAGAAHNTSGVSAALWIVLAVALLTAILTVRQNLILRRDLGVATSRLQASPAGPDVALPQLGDTLMPVVGEDDGGNLKVVAYAATAAPRIFLYFGLIAGPEADIWLHRLAPLLHSFRGTSVPPCELILLAAAEGRTIVNSTMLAAAGSPAAQVIYVHEDMRRAYGLAVGPAVLLVEPTGILRIASYQTWRGIEEAMQSIIDGECGGR